MLASAWAIFSSSYMVKGNMESASSVFVLQSLLILLCFCSHLDHN